MVLFLGVPYRKKPSHAVLRAFFGRADYIEPDTETSAEEVREKLIDITADGIISEDEQIDLKEILSYLDGLIKAAGELRIIGLKAIMNGGA